MHRSRTLLLGTALFAALAAAPAAATLPDAHPGPTADATTCTPLPTSIRGTYRRLPPVDGRFTPRGFEISLGRCTSEARWRGALLGKGAYTMTRGDSRYGEVVLYDDVIGPCREVGPTAYEYVLDGYLLSLRIVGGRDRDACTPRANDLHDHRFVKRLDGPVRIVITGTRQGTFRAAGVLRDAGRFARTPARAGMRLTLTGGKGVIVMLERRTRRGSRIWTVIRGIQSYVGLTGRGTITGSPGRVVLRGSVSNLPAGG